MPSLGKERNNNAVDVSKVLKLLTMHCFIYNSETDPWKKEKLLSGLGCSGGPHEVDLCGMCQKLGYPCNNAKPEFRKNYLLDLSDSDD